MVNLKYPILAAVDATVQTFVIGFAGVILAWCKIFKKSGAEALGKLTMNLFLPALMFTTLIDDIDLNDLGGFLKVLLFTVSNVYLVHVVIGIAIGTVMGYLLRSSADVRHMIATCLAFQDTTAIPLLFVDSLANNGVTDSDSDFKKKGTMYVLLFTVFISFFKWTVAYRMLAKAPKTEPITSDDKPLDPILKQDTDAETHSSGVSRHILTLWGSLKKSLNPPVYAVILALPLCLIPDVSKVLFLEGGAVFKYNAYAGFEKIGEMTTVAILLILGQNLSRGYPPSADISHWELWSAVVGRLVVMPLIGMGIFLGFYHIGFSDRVLTFTMMNIYACPTSLQLLMICAEHRNQRENISKLYLFVYIGSMGTMALFTIWFLAILY